MPLPTEDGWLQAQSALAGQEWARSGWRCVLTRPEQWHLTWFFLNRVEDDQVAEVEAAMENAVESIRLADCDPAFRLAGVGCFAGPVWAGIEFRSRKFAELLRDARSELEVLGFETRGRFRPHVTLGRIKPDIASDDVVTELTSGSLKRAARTWFDQHRGLSGEWVENPEFVLIESIVSHEGAEHISRGRWSLVRG